MRLAGIGTYVQTQHDDHEAVVGQGEIDLVHDQELTISELRIGVDVGITKRFGASLMLPIRSIGTSIRYLDMSGAEVELVQAGIHHRNERVTGIADPMLLGSAAATLGSWRLTGRAGLTIPLGRTEEDPFALGDQNLAHQHIQMGTGTVNPVVAVEVARSWDLWRFGVFGLTQQVLYENGKGYHAGDRYAVGAALRRRLGSRWSVRGAIDVQGETAERWNGIAHMDDGNRGRFDLIVGAGASWSATDQLNLDLALKVPVVTHAVGGQLEMPAIVELGASWSFGATPVKPAAEDDHDHEHGDHDHGEHAHEGEEHAGDEHAHDEHTPAVVAPEVVPPEVTPAEPAEPAEPTKVAPKTPKPVRADIADLGPPGAAVALVPVTAKITIFDFWAAWCKPCKTLEPALVTLAREYPTLVALRRIDVIDWDSAAAAKHLTPGGFNLPHLKIFGTAGTIVFEQSSETGKLEHMIASVRGLVEAEAKKRGLKPIAATKKASPPAPATSSKKSAPAAVVRTIVVTAKGFEPANVKVPVGKPVTLRFDRRVEKSCATEVVMDVDGKRIVKDLPLGKPVDLTVTFSKPGTVTYACAMDMIRGSITVE